MVGTLTCTTVYHAVVPGVLVAVSAKNAYTPRWNSAPILATLESCEPCALLPPFYGTERSRCGTNDSEPGTEPLVVSIATTKHCSYTVAWGLHVFHLLMMNNTMRTRIVPSLNYLVCDLCFIDSCFVVFCFLGNDGSQCSTIDSPPGTEPLVVSVAASNRGSDTAASFSSRGPAKDSTGTVHRFVSCLCALCLCALFLFICLFTRSCFNFVHVHGTQVLFLGLGLMCTWLVAGL